LRTHARQFSTETLYCLVQQKRISLLTECMVTTKAPIVQSVTSQSGDLREILPVLAERDAMRAESRKVRRFAIQLPCKLYCNEDTWNGTVLNLFGTGACHNNRTASARLDLRSLDVNLLNAEGPAKVEWLEFVPRTDLGWNHPHSTRYADEIEASILLIEQASE